MKRLLVVSTLALTLGAVTAQATKTALKARPGKITGKVLENAPEGKNPD